MYDSKKIATYTKRELAEFVVLEHIPLQILENDGLTLRQMQLLEQEIKLLQQDEKDWAAAQADGTNVGYQRYLEKYDKPSSGLWDDTTYRGRHVGEAKDYAFVPQSQPDTSDNTELIHNPKPVEPNNQDSDQRDKPDDSDKPQFTKPGSWFKWALIAIAAIIVVWSGIAEKNTHDEISKSNEMRWRANIQREADRLSDVATQLYTAKRFAEARKAYNKSVEFRNGYDFLAPCVVSWLGNCDTIILAQQSGTAITDGLAQELNHYKAHSPYSCGYAYVPKLVGYDYIDHRGNSLTFAKKPEKAGAAFKDSLLKVEETGGYVDINGNVQSLGNIFSRWESFSEGLAAVQDRATGKWGYINTFLSIKIEPEFDYATDFIEGFALVRKGDNWYYINKDASKRFEVPGFKKQDSGYSHAIDTYYFINDLAPAGINDNGERIFMTKDGRRKRYNTNDKDNLQHRFYSDLRLFRDSTNRGRYGYEDKNGHIVIPSAYNMANGFKGKYAIVGNDYSNYGLINKSGGEVLPLKYKDLGWLDDDMLKFSTIVTIEDENNAGNNVDNTSKKTKSKREETQTKSKPRKEKLYGVINLKGDTIHPAIYTSIGNFSEGFAVVERDKNNWGYIDKYGLSTYDYVPLPSDSITIQPPKSSEAEPKGSFPSPERDNGWILSWILFSVIVCALTVGLYYLTNWLYPIVAKYVATKIKSLK